MDIKLDQDQMMTVVSGALLKAITVDQQKTLIEGAIKHLLDPQKTGNSYSSTYESPIQRAFKDAVERIAVLKANEILEHDPVIQGKIKDLILEGINRMFEDETREKAVTRIGQAIVKAFSGDSY